MGLEVELRIRPEHSDNFENLTCSELKTKNLDICNLRTMLTTKMMVMMLAIMKMMMMLTMVMTVASQLAISSAR